MTPTVSVALSIYNQQMLIEPVIRNLVANLSTNVIELVICFDGCTDKTEEITKSILKDIKIPTTYLYADNVFEVKANNLCFKACKGDMIFTLQDDMIVLESDCDKRLMKPFSVVDKLLGVTARNAQDEIPSTNWLGMECTNVFGADVHSPRDIFGIRDIIVRGPIMFNHAILKEMNYLDEEFAPLNLDDKDLCYRAWRKGYKVGAYMMNYRSDEAWGKTRNDATSNSVYEMAIRKNHPILLSKHMDLIAGEKHDENISVP